MNQNDSTVEYIVEKLHPYDIINVISNKTNHPLVPAPNVITDIKTNYPIVPAFYVISDKTNYPLVPAFYVISDKTNYPLVPAPHYNKWSTSGHQLQLFLCLLLPSQWMICSKQSYKYIHRVHEIIHAKICLSFNNFQRYDVTTILIGLNNFKNLLHFVIKKK
jgi:hypothetical protein